MTDKKSRDLSMESLDEQLRSVENNLQQEDGKLDAKNMGGFDGLDESSGNVGNIDKIREILFGGHARDYDRRFKRLEERLSQEQGHLREDISQRIRAMEDLLNNELDNLAEKAKAERQERQLAYQDLKNDLGALRTETTSRLNQLDEQITRDIKQVRQQLQGKHQEVSSLLRQQVEMVVSMVKQEIAQLQEEKVSRNDLASFFSEFAMRLNRDFNVVLKGDKTRKSVSEFD